jgi:hypothetical protein
MAAEVLEAAELEETQAHHHQRHRSLLNLLNHRSLILRVAE